MIQPLQTLRVTAAILAAGVGYVMPHSVRSEERGHVRVRLALGKRVLEPLRAWKLELRDAA